MPLPSCGPKRMIPRSFQLPPVGKGASQSVTTGPPVAWTVFNLPSAKNPIDRPSADQNGSCAPSVPARGCAEGESKGRDHSKLLPCASTRTSSRIRPSGETFGKPTNCAPGGGVTEEISKGGRKLTCPRKAASTARSTTTLTATAAQATLSRLLRLVTAKAGAPVCEPLSTTQFNSLLRSLELCQRSSRSLAKHFLTT